MREPRIAASPERSLVAMALENAVEGCVNETFGAAVAMAAIDDGCKNARVRWQRCARSRATMKRHAEARVDVAAWVETRLERTRSA